LQDQARNFAGSVSQSWVSEQVANFVFASFKFFLCNFVFATGPALSSGLALRHAF
jgi:hypothetical protein